MQRERGALDSFHETIDLNQGSLPNSTSMDQSDAWNNMLSPDENRLSNYMLSSTSENVRCTPAANDHTPSFSFWDRGESSSNTSNMQDEACGDDSRTRPSWSSSLYTSSGTNVRSVDWPFEPSSSTSSSSRGIGIGHPYGLNKSSNSETEPSATFYAACSNVGTSSGSSSTFPEINDAPGPSFSNWGSSCKRKALEGTSEQLYPGGSSSSIRPTEKNMILHPSPTYYPGPRSLSTPSGSLNLSPSYRSECINPSSGGVTSNMPRGSFPSSGAPCVGEISARNFSIRSNHGRNESVPSNTPRGTSVRHFGVNAAQMSQPVANTDFSELRLPIPPHLNPNSPSRPYSSHLNEAREMHFYPWDGSFGSRGGSSSGSGAREDSNVRSSGRNNLEYLMAVSSPETRNISQDQIDWSFAPGASASSRNQSSVPRVGLGSGGQTSSAGWLPHENPTSPNQQLSEMAPWIPFPRGESESGNRRRHFTVSPSVSSTSDEAGSTRRAQHQFHRSSAGFLMDMPEGDDSNGWRALAAVEGRHRLIRQVLNAMRRGAHLQAEDYTFIDPFINGIAELHDRHRDMRVDVDNMSYEELLALEERIGNVSTGLSEEKITGFMKQRKHEAMRVSLNLEPCCICQENYTIGNDIGILDCGHEFHANCIKQWLTVKNLCPICKTTALET